MVGRKVALVGFSELSREWANEMTGDVEIWGINEAHTFLKRWDRWFQIHPRNWNTNLVSEKGYTFSGHCNSCGWEQTGKPFEPQAVERVKHTAQKHANANPEHEVEAGVVRFTSDGYGRTPHHLRWLGRCGVPVFMQAVDERVPTSVRYPFEAVTEALGIPDVNGKKRLYLTSSPAWQIALVLYEHKQGQTISEIHTPGIEMLLGTEYARQKPCFEWWLGLAMGMGIQWVRPPGGSSLLSDGIYAVDYLEPLKNEDEKTYPIYAPEVADLPLVSITQDAKGVPTGLG